VAAGDTQVAHLWAGSGHARARAAPADEITRELGA
jgi:nitronate monooxygenase